MGYCGPRGIPHSEFLSWSVDDQAKALWWSAEQADRCPECGTHEWEWEEDGDAYRAESYVCRGCARVQTEQGKGDSSKMPGLHVHLVKGGTRG